MNEIKLKETNQLQVFGGDFEQAQRMAKALCSSTMIPKEYQNNISNTLIALEMSARTGASPLMVMQNLYIVHGKPGWSSSFIIAAINNCGRFNSLRFVISGSGDSLKCYAVTEQKNTNIELKGVEVSMQMAKAEGWVQKNGSKWQTMPELMIRYRAAAFWGRLYAPEIMMGMQTAEEVIDITCEEVKTPAPDPLSEKKPIDENVNTTIIQPENGKLL